jgi:hypothetical protein
VDEPAPAKSIYSIELRDKNFDNLTNRELVEWLDKELRLRGAEEFGFRKVVLSEKVAPASPSGMGGQIGRAPLSTVLWMMRTTSWLDWYYEFGVLTLFSRKTEERRLCLFSLDSPLLAGIDFNDTDLNRIKVSILNRFCDLSFFSVIHELNDGSVLWSNQCKLVPLYLARPDAEAAYALDQIMRQSNFLKIVEPPAGKESDVDTTKPSVESHEKESNPEKPKK